MSLIDFSKPLRLNEVVAALLFFGALVGIWTQLNIRIELQAQEIATLRAEVTAQKEVRERVVRIETKLDYLIGNRNEVPQR
jgi:hypothetical protein